jgi:hypothetical protein
MQGVLPPAIVERRWKADCTDEANDGAAGDHATVVNILESSLMIERGYVKRDVTQKELHRLKDQLRGTRIAAWNITDLTALELWLQVFFGGNVPAQGVSHAAAG